MKKLKNTHRLHLQIGPNHWLIYTLNFMQSVSFFICSGSEFQICRPKVLRLLSPYLTVTGELHVN